MAGFEDQDFQEEYDQDYFEETAFANTNSMWDYFDEVSKGALNIEGNVYGPYTLDGDAADYSSGSSFVRDSVEIADDDIYWLNEVKQLIAKLYIPGPVPELPGGHDAARRDDGVEHGHARADRPAEPLRDRTVLGLIYDGTRLAGTPGFRDVARAHVERAAASSV